LLNPKSPDVDAALAAMQPYRDDRAPPACRLVLARIRMVQGNLAKLTGHKEEAAEAFREAQDAAEAVCKALAGDRARTKLRRTARFLLAEVLSNSNDLLGPPEETHRKALELREQLVDEDPDNPLFQAYLAASHNWLANALATQNHLDDARSHYHEALKILDELSRRFPSIPAFQQERDEVRQNLKTVGTS
jgi:tetratricopeptide (TPR) repeat protein